MSDLDALAERIATQVADYRAHDGVALDAERVLRWAHGFDSEDRAVVLGETARVMAVRYIRRKDARRVFRAALKTMASKYGYAEVPAYLAETALLDLQPAWKSQPALLAILDEVLAADYNLTRADCGAAGPKRWLYVDDVLCTGNTAYQDVTRWLGEPVPGGRRIDTLTSPVPVEFVALVLHDRHWHKLSARLRYWDRRIGHPTVWRAVAVQNSPGSTAATLDCALPRRSAMPGEVLAYAVKLGMREDEVFRPEDRPSKETFFSSPAARDQFERAITVKGLELLGRVTAPKPNLRPLGYVLPSHNTLGFGALAFTWRNVPNTTPLVFWYDAPGWTPLFEKRLVTAADEFGVLA